MPAKNYRKEHKPRSRLRRLVTANLIALLGLLTVAAAVLFCLGLWDSIWTFIF